MTAIMIFTKNITMRKKINQFQQRKKFDYKELKPDDYYYTYDQEKDTKLELDEETKEPIEEIKEKEQNVDKNGFSGYFGHKPKALMSKLMSKNTPDL